ncbi:hypothetical protein AOLI_G00171170 [Acnodon oligacanthus]
MNFQEQEGSFDFQLLCTRERFSSSGTKCEFVHSYDEKTKAASVLHQSAGPSACSWRRFLYCHSAEKLDFWGQHCCTKAVSSSSSFFEKLKGKSRGGNTALPIEAIDGWC